MANNSNRKAIEFMVQGALPPHSTNVLWMDTSVPELPVLKIFENGAWNTVHTEQSKIDTLLAKTVFEQSKIIDELTNGLDIKVDEVKSDVYDVKTAMENIDFTPVEEKQDEQFVHSLTHTRNDYMAEDSQLNRIVVRFGINDFRNYDLVGIEVVDNITYYKWGTANTMPIGYIYTDKWKELSRFGGDAVYVKEGDTMVRLKDQYGNNNNTWQAQSFKNATTRDISEAKQDIINALGNIDFTPLAKEAQATLNKEAIITAVNNAQPDLSSVAKQGSNPNATNTAILEAMPTVPTVQQIQNGLASESNATANKNEVKQEIHNVAGPCIIPDWTEECLPFIPDGFCAIYGDADYVFGDFAPACSDAEDFKVGDIILVTGDPESQDEWDGYPEGSTLAVARTVDTPSLYPSEESGLYQDSEGNMHGILTHIVWESGHYYRVTGIVECYSESLHELISIFTYEEVDPATITDLGKQLSDKIDNQVAKESTSLEIKELVLREGIILANQYAETINDIVGDFSNE